jgi:hypothetical protein
MPFDFSIGNMAGYQCRRVKQLVRLMGRTRSVVSRLVWQLLEPNGTSMLRYLTIFAHRWRRHAVHAGAMKVAFERPSPCGGCTS